MPRGSSSSAVGISVNLEILRLFEHSVRAGPVYCEHGTSRELPATIGNLVRLVFWKSTRALLKDLAVFDWKLDQLGGA
jgi:hypothetical protein